MKAEELYKLMGDKTSPDDLVVIIDNESKVISTIKGVVREYDEDTKVATVFVQVEEL